MSEVGLTETVHSGKGSDARKFELWLQGITVQITNGSRRDNNGCF